MAEDIDKLIQQLLDASGEARLTLQRQVQRALVGGPLERLVEALSAPQDVVRRAAVEACKRRTEPELTPALEALAQDEDSEVRSGLAEVVGLRQIGALDSVLKALFDDREAQVRHGAVEAAAQRVQFREELVRRLPEDPDWAVRQAAARGLRGYPASEVIVPLFVSAAHDEDDDVTQEAVSSIEVLLGELGEYPEDYPRPPEATLLKAWKRLREQRPGQHKRLEAWLGAAAEQAVDEEKLAGYGTDLTQLAERGELSRAHEVDSICELLEKTIRGRGNRSSVLVGRSGCGKTAIVQELAHRLKDDPDGPWRIIRVSPSDLMVGTRYLGEWETRTKELVEAVRAPRRVILHVPNFETLTSVGRSANSETNVAELLAPHIEDGSVILLGESTPEHFEQGMGRVASLRRLFRQVLVSSADAERTRRVLAAVREEECADISDAVLDRLFEMATYYLPGAAMPGPAIGLLRGVLAARTDATEAVTESEILTGLSTSTGIPQQLLDDARALDLGRVRAFFEERVMGQPEGVEAMVDLVTLVKAGLTDPNKPFGVLLFVGPTGVGKTELARALAEFIFGDPARLLRFDMSEFASVEGFERLIGRGTESGLLTRAVQERPFSVVLLDEIEKSHINVFDLCLQLFDAGRLTDGRGQTVDFRRTIVILTSNVGAGSPDDARVGFLSGGQGDAPEAAREATFRELSRFFRPEFLNRIDRIINFRALTREVAERIAQREIRQVLRRSGIRRRGLQVDVDPAVITLLLAAGYSTHFGARPLKRAVERLILLPLGKAISTGKPLDSSVLRLLPAGRKVRVQVVPPEGTDEPEARTPAGVDASRLQAQAEKIHERLAELKAEVEPFEKRKSELLRQSSESGFWSDSDKAHETLDEVHRLDEVLRSLDGLGQVLAGVTRHVERIGERRGGQADPEELAALEERLEGMAAEAEQLGFLLHCEDVQDLGDALVYLTSVGEEGDDLGGLRRLADMYQAFARRRHLDCEVLAECEGGEAREASAVLQISGKGAFALLKGEAGMHKIVRKQQVSSGPERWQHDRNLVRVEILPVPREKPQFDSNEIQIAVKSQKSTDGKVLERADLEINLFHRSTFTSIRARTRGPNDEAIARMEMVLGARIEANRKQRSEDDTPLVRRYHLGSSPRVKDYRSGRSTPRVDRVFKGFLDPFLVVNRE